ncbi:site-specific integrase [Candidatus Pacearchaeota archaeon]|nr:site-specific integrase [Candidatus Pacearchaeota archaeon]
MKIMDLYNKQGMFDTTVRNIQKSPNILSENKKTILRFIDHLRSENISIARITRCLFDLKRYDRLLSKPFQEANKDDIRRVVGEVNGSPLSEASKKEMKLMIRKVHCFIKGVEGKDYPEEVKWISLRMPSNHKKLPEELLTEEEIQALVRGCTNTRDKALIMTLAESGCRVSEIGTRQIKHISFEEYGTRITVDGKTGMRKILVIHSTPYLQEWINNHPHNDDPEAALWYNPQKSEFLCYARISHILKGAAKKARIKKKVHLHLLRHSRATQLASVMSDAQLKTYLGWTAGSKMASTYIHMSGKDTDSALLKASGIEIKREHEKPLLQSTLCLRCKSNNKGTNRCCYHCGFILDNEAAKEVLVQDTNQKDMNHALDILIRDPEVLTLLTRKLKELRA